MPSSDLTWTEANSPVNRIDEYRIFKSTNVFQTSPGFADSFVLLDTGDDLLVINDPEPPFGDTHPLTFSDTAVDFSTNFYCYRVDAYSVLVGEATGGSPQTGVGPSNIVCIGTPAAAPTLSGNKIDNGQLDLSWVNGSSGVNPIFSTRIYRSVNNGAFTLLATVLMPTLTFSDTTVDNLANEYAYKVTSNDEAGIESADSNTVEFGFFVDALLAVSIAGPATDKVAFSFDAGRSWTLADAANGNAWNGVAYSSALQLLVAVSSTGDIDQVMTSSDGVNWTGFNAASVRNWRDVAWSPTLNLFAAVADTVAGNRVMTSPDGEVWTERVTPADLAWHVIEWVDFLGLFVAAANVAANDCVMTSTDGIVWTQITLGSGSISCMADRGDRLSMRSEASFFGLITDDGSTWTPTGAENSGCQGLAHGAGRFVVIGGGAANRQQSTTGISWTNTVMPNLAWRSIVFTPDTAEFVVVGSTTSSVTSDDGLAWTEHTLVLPSGGQWFAMINAQLPAP